MKLAVLAALAAAVLAPSAAACPKGALPLPANPLGSAAAAALRADTPKNRPLVTGATLAPYAGVRGEQAKRACGAALWRRTVVVYVLDRSFLPSQSASQRVVFVARFRGGWRVWQRAH